MQSHFIPPGTSPRLVRACRPAPARDKHRGTEIVVNAAWKIQWKFFGNQTSLKGKRAQRNFAAPGKYSHELVAIGVVVIPIAVGMPAWAGCGPTAGPCTPTACPAAL